MHRIDTVGNQDGRFFDGDPSAGKPPTLLNSAWFNAVQEEIAAVIEGAGIELSKGEIQLPKALDRIIAASLSAALKELVAQLDVRFQAEMDARERGQRSLRESIANEAQTRGEAITSLGSVIRDEMSSVKNALNTTITKEIAERKGDTETTNKRIAEEVSKLLSLIPIMKSAPTTGTLAEMVLQTSDVGWSLQLNTRVGNEVRTAGIIKGRNS